MKKSLTLLIAFIAIFTATKAQDTITNPGFERWNNAGTYDEPIGWNTLNPLTSTLGTVMAFKVTGPADVNSGTNAIKLVSKTVLGTARPSLLTTGTINIITSTVDGGAPISARPLFFSGKYKYSPVNGDTAFFLIRLTKWNGTSSDVVGQGALKVTAASATYNNFSVPVNYTSAVVPDTVQLLIISGSNFATQVNSILFVDDVFYDFSTGINENTVAETSLFPNPTDGVATLKFNVDNSEAININLYNTLGQKVRNVYTGKTGNGTNQVQFSTAGLPAGVYSVQLTVGTKTYNQQLVVN